MSRRLLVLLLATACETPFEAVTLEPYPNPFGPSERGWAPQPRRENPKEVAWEAGAEAVWVSLQGSEDEPGNEVARVDLATGDVERVEVGASPTGLALHPDGDLLVVLNRFSNWASVVDTRARREVGRIPADFYATEAVFTPDGGELWVTNRWHDAVEVWPLRREGRTLVLDGPIERVPVGDNPRDLAISADGRTVAVGALTGLTTTLVDVERREAIGDLWVGAPSNGLAFVGGFLYVATLSASTHHLALDGPDGDGDGVSGDGTPNVNFQDLNNELSVWEVDAREEVFRYTSDTICCKDFRDVHPDDVRHHGDLLPPVDHWIVGGALPEQIASDEAAAQVAVAYSGSNQWQLFDVDTSTGALTPGLVRTSAGHSPHGIAFAGERVLVAHRLGETLGVYDRTTGEVRANPVVGDVSGGAFPATDAEIGELVNFVTAPFTVDGDQVCAACHREGGNIDKALSMPLTVYPGMGLRMTMAYRGAADTRPWFFESAMDDANFKPVLNEFARIENFCCSDVTLFPDGIPADCAENPPAICATAPSPGSPDLFNFQRGAGFEHPRPTPFPNRDALTLAGMDALVGRTESFGDGAFFEDPISGDRSPIRLGFDGMTRVLGLFLLIEPRFLPNPNDPTRAAALRGRALFERGDVGCSSCHPAPTFTASRAVNPSGVPLQMAPVVTPLRREDGVNLDLLSNGFLMVFPESSMDSCASICGEAACAEDPAVCDDLRDVRLGAPTLRGIWDRADSMLHHGLAKGLREVLATPGHPVLREGERGFNERDGIPDSHGGTSHLTAQEVEDLITYLETL